MTIGNGFYERLLRKYVATVMDDDFVVGIRCCTGEQYDPAETEEMAKLLNELWPEGIKRPTTP